MRMDLDIDDRTLLDLASRPRTTRQRSSSRNNASTLNAPQSFETSTVGSSPQSRRNHHQHSDDEEDEDENEGDDESVSIYRESLSPPPPNRSNAPSSSTFHGYPSQALDAASAKFASASVSAISGGKPPQSGGNKRGRKPAPAASRSAREQARKTNHSRIEKRRREKINDALATLREIVPINIAQMVAVAQAQPGADASLSTSMEAGGSGQASVLASPALSAQGAKKGGEKEFKLEVLERTVIFVKHLIEKVADLESGLYQQSHHNATTLCSRCGDHIGDASHPNKDSSDLSPPITHPINPVANKRRRSDQETLNSHHDSTNVSNPGKRIRSSPNVHSPSTRAPTGIGAEAFIPPIELTPSAVPLPSRSSGSGGRNSSYNRGDPGGAVPSGRSGGGANTGIGMTSPDNGSRPRDRAVSIESFPSPTTTLAYSNANSTYSTPYMDATTWGSSVSGTAGVAVGGGRSREVVIEEDERTSTSPSARPSLPSIASMLNPSPPTNMNSPSLVASTYTSSSSHNTPSGDAVMSSSRKPLGLNDLLSSSIILPSPSLSATGGASQATSPVAYTNRNSRVDSHEGGGSGTGMFQLPSSSIPPHSRAISSSSLGGGTPAQPHARTRGHTGGASSTTHTSGSMAEDETTAVALLIHLSSDRSSHSNSSNKSVRSSHSPRSAEGVSEERGLQDSRTTHGNARHDEEDRVNAQTPGSILGMAGHRTL